MLKAIISMVLFVVPAFGQETAKKLTFEAMIDGYYAYDFNQPQNKRRDYTTQPVKNKTPAINLAHIASQYRTKKTRFRLAIQSGDSVKRNTLFEPALANSNGDLTVRMIQEAYVGKKIGEKTWIDGGIYLGHIGAESWISKENWTYTRALNLDYVPYYSAGLRLSHELNQKESLQFHIMNGWQNIGENNSAKAIGFQYHLLLTNDLAFTYNNFFGDEEIVPNKQQKFRSRFRGYHNFILRWTADEKWQYLAALDFGHQAQQDKSGVDGLWAGTLTLRRILSAKQSFALRGEMYQDPHEVNVLTPSRQGFEVTGASINFDQKITHNALWRTEIRTLQSQQKIFPTKEKFKKGDNFLVTSLSFWL